MARLHIQVLLLIVITPLVWCFSVDPLNTETAIHLDGHLVRLKRKSCHADEYLLNDICCKKCQAGKLLKSHCTSSSDTVCEDCSNGNYLDEPSANTKCKQCRICDNAHNLHPMRHCSATSDAICGCNEGSYCSHKDGPESCLDCKPHTTCPPGAEIAKPASLLEDVECRTCGVGSYSPGGNVTCKRHTDCSSEGMVIVLPVENTKDVECTHPSKYVPIIEVASVVFVVVVVVVVFIIIMWKCPNKLRCIFKKPENNSEEENKLFSTNPEQPQQNHTQLSDGWTAQTSAEITDEFKRGGDGIKLSVSREREEPLQMENSGGEQATGTDDNDSTDRENSEDDSPPSPGTEQPLPPQPFPPQQSININITNIYPQAPNVDVKVDVQLTTPEPTNATPSETPQPPQPPQPSQPTPPSPLPGNQARPDTQPWPETQPNPSTMPSLHSQISSDGDMQGDNFTSAHYPIDETTRNKIPIQEQGEVATEKDSCSYRESEKESGELAQEPGDPVV
ncbi:uncharacterized protein LOC133344750 isoform X3 [Lethenteron reissneri]|uniref:uncharacterized protein LOC133344750 isoform X3 n=1 Tax=Lethenteron reissneri TaxID=7753 RepID=UPI002AB7E7B9|nr:uncharacterized protein LOC133344750 isoform X3 [Lethenteron reissneri]XP_061410881.1 uncharacterized protein LOC133344750 isoform X3 [Lethenteron reissneri]